MHCTALKITDKQVHSNLNTLFLKFLTSNVWKIRIYSQITSNRYLGQSSGAGLYAQSQRVTHTRFEGLSLIRELIFFFPPFFFLSCSTWGRQPCWRWNGRLWSALPHCAATLHCPTVILVALQGRRWGGGGQLKKPHCLFVKKALKECPV